MRRSLPHRILAALCALWLAISIAAPGLVHDCPMHGAVSPVRVGHAATAAATAAATGHGSHHAAHALERGQDEGRQAAPVCSCVGDCSAAGAVSLAAPALALLDAAMVPVRDAGLPDHAYVPVAHALLLPFANGPPSLPPSTRVL